MLWSRVREASSGCWEWTGALSTGYGVLRFGGRQAYTHRIAYEIVVGLIPSGLQIDHLCRNRACCNPAHLEPVTRRENLMRGNGPAAVNARKETCPHGHDYAGANLYVAPNGRRGCRACRQAALDRRDLRAA